MLCEKCGKEVLPGNNFCRWCGTPVSEADKANSGPFPSGTSPVLEMKWFNFLIYFSLWVGGILSILSSFTYFTGSMYYSAGVSPGWIGLYYPGMRVLDVLYGVACIMFGAYSIYTRYQLAGFKEIGPKCLIKLYVGSFLCNVLYNVFVAAILDTMTEVFPTVISTLIVGIPFVLANVKYFKKRDAMFRYD